MKYTVIDKNYASDLKEEVEALLKQGWKLQGGVSAYATTARFHYVQALIKE